MALAWGDHWRRGGGDGGGWAGVGVGGCGADAGADTAGGVEGTATAGTPAPGPCEGRGWRHQWRWGSYILHAAGLRWRLFGGIHSILV